MSIDNPADVPFLDVKFDRKAIARYGLTIDTVSAKIETAFAGQAVSRIMEYVGSFDLVVRYGEGALEDLDVIRSTLIMTASGAQLPLPISVKRVARTPSAVKIRSARLWSWPMPPNATCPAWSRISVPASSNTSVCRRVIMSKWGQFESAEQAPEPFLLSVLSAS